MKDQKGLKLKRKIIIGILAFLLLLIYAAPVLAVETEDMLPKKVIVKAWTDKTSYKPGETCHLNIIIFNNSPDDYYIKNITIYYFMEKDEWLYFYDKEKEQWMGFQIIEPEPDTLRSGDLRSCEAIIEIPSGNVISGGTYQIEVIVHLGTKILSPEQTPEIQISYEEPITVEGLGKIVTLLAVLIILIVLSAVAISAAVYLSLAKLKKPPEHPMPSLPESKKAE